MKMRNFEIAPGGAYLDEIWQDNHGFEMEIVDVKCKMLDLQGMID